MFKPRERSCPLPAPAGATSWPAGAATAPPGSCPEAPCGPVWPPLRRPPETPAPLAHFGWPISAEAFPSGPPGLERPGLERPVLRDPARREMLPANAPRFSTTVCPPCGDSASRCRHNRRTVSNPPHPHPQAVAMEAANAKTLRPEPDRTATPFRLFPAPQERAPGAGG